MLLTCHTNRAAVLLQALLLAPLCLAAEPYRDPFTSQMQPLQPVDNQAILPPRPLSSLSVPINHSNLAQLLTIVQTQNLLSAQGKAFIDERTHSLIIRDHAQQFNEIKQLVAQLDKPQPPIHIAAHIVTISSESLAELGVRWSYLGGDSQFINKYNINLGVGSPTGLLGINVFKHAGHILNLELSALETENQVEIIASPTLLTSNLRTASIKQGTEIPYAVSSGSSGATSIEFKQAVLGLEVTPILLPNGQLELDLFISQNMAGQAIKMSEGGEALAIDTQEIRSQVQVSDGDTIVLGGIFQQITTQNQSQVPLLSQLPLLGPLFAYNSHKLQRRELLIFITPQLIPLN